MSTPLEIDAEQIQQLSALLQEIHSQHEKSLAQARVLQAQAGELSALVDTANARQILLSRLLHASQITLRAVVDGYRQRLDVSRELLVGQPATPLQPLARALGLRARRPPGNLADDERLIALGEAALKLVASSLEACNAEGGVSTTTPPG